MKIDSTSALFNYEANKIKSLDTKPQNKDDVALKEQTDAFEAILLKFMLDTSLKLDNPLYPKEAGSEIYQSMYKETLSNQLAGSFGYSQMLFNWLKEQQRG